MVTEVFKFIDGFMNYQVSNFGRVRNIKTGRFLKLGTINSGYHVVILSKGGKVKQESMHRLVAQEFIENPDNKKCIDHIDRNRSNNAVVNLRWVSNAENI
ncbi:MAG: NUMOD4 domain-containing protein [Candidatus Fonsibacter sp.]